MDFSIYISTISIVSIQPKMYGHLSKHKAHLQKLDEDNPVL